MITTVNQLAFHVCEKYDYETTSPKGITARKTTELFVRCANPVTMQSIAASSLAVRDKYKLAEQKRMARDITARLKADPPCEFGILLWLGLAGFVLNLIRFLWSWYDRNKDNAAMIQNARQTMGLDT